MLVHSVRRSFGRVCELIVDLSPQVLTPGAFPERRTSHADDRRP